MDRLNQRIKSFIGTEFPHPPNVLAEAGFYYLECKELCMTFCCGLLVDGWMPEDDPLFEHALHSEDCNYIKRKTRKLKIIQNVTQPTVIARTDSLCKVCKINEANYVNIPCSHLATCAECVKKQEEGCVICKPSISCFLNIFI